MPCIECGDVDITPCAPSIPVDPIPVKRCNPCKKISCKQKLDSQCVVYKLNRENCGEGLPYLNIQNGTTVDDALEVIDDTFAKIDKPTLINCFATKSNINTQEYNLNAVLLKLQEGYCKQTELSVSSVQSILELIRDTPSLKSIFCEIVSSCNTEE